MAYTLVHAGTILDNTASTVFVPFTVTCTSTTAGNLLVLGYAADSVISFTALTGPSGWTQAVTAAATSQGATGIWYLPNCAPGITSVSVTWAPTGSAGRMYAQLLEFNDAAGSNLAPLDVTGTATGLTSPQAIATSGPTTAANELAVSVFQGIYGSATKDTVTAGTGFTTAGGAAQGAKTIGHGLIDYKLDTGATGTVTDSVTFTGPFGGAGSVIATFKTFTAAPAGLLPQQLRSRAPLTSRREPAGRADYGR